MSELVLERVDQADAGKSLDVVFVHGLGGDHRETWMADAKDGATFWPAWIAEDHPETAVWSLGYPAKLTKWGNAGDAMALPDRAKQVLNYLKGHGIADRATVFVAHSLGGLLVKQLLRTAEELGGARYGTIVETTKGVVFLATPHAGSDLAGLAAGLRIFRPSAEVESLVAHDPHLANLAEWWRLKAQSLGISTYAYRENRKIKGRWVVDPTSADPAIPGALVIPQDEDHFSISKPVSRAHPVYVGVRTVLNPILQAELAPPPVAAAAGEVVMKPSIRIDAAEAMAAEPTAARLIQGHGYVIQDPRPEWNAAWTSRLELLSSEGGMVDRDFLEGVSRNLGGLPLDVKDVLDVRSRNDYTIEIQAGESFLNGSPATLFDHPPVQVRLMVSRINRFLAPPGVAPSLMTTAVGEMVAGVQAGFTPRSLNPVRRSDGKRALVTEREKLLSRVTVNGQADTDLAIRLSQVVIEGDTHHYSVSIFTLAGEAVLSEDLENLQRIAGTLRIVDPLDPAAEVAAARAQAAEMRRVVWQQAVPQIEFSNLYRIANVYAGADLTDSGVQVHLAQDARRVVALLAAYGAAEFEDELIGYAELREALELPEPEGAERLVELTQELIDSFIVS